MNEDRLEPDRAEPWFLYAARGLGDGSYHPLPLGDTCIGRDEGSDIHLALFDPAVSRLHATIARYAGEETAWLQDRGSSNGVFVNGRRVDGVAIRPGDVVRLGDTMLVVGRGEPAAPEDEAQLGVLGRSPVVAELRAVVRKVAPSALPVLIVGATGTGKDVVARAVHDASGRRGRIVAVNCAALPGTLVESVLFGHKRGAFTGAVSDAEGAFVQASGGTLFLDEVGDLALEAQPKLLRALENGEITPVGTTSPVRVDVRVVAATHVALDAEMDAGTFRRDLYGRLAGVVVRTPPLVERRADVLPLFRSFLGESGARELSADFVESLLVHAWPFNVRELRKLAERLLVLHADAPRWERGMLHKEMRPLLDAPPRSDAPSVSGLPSAAPVAGADDGRREGPPPARAELLALLAQCDGNVSRVAELVGRNRKQVYRWMEQHAIERGTGRKR